MTARDSRLDRMLALASTPQVPPDLAARIVRDVTSLPQQVVAPRAEQPTGASGRHTRHWLRAASFAAIVLISGTTLAMLTRDGPDDDRIDEQVAVIDRTAPPPSPAASPATGALADAAPSIRQSGAPGSHPADRSKPPLIRNEKAPAGTAEQPSPTELASETPVNSPITKPAEGLAENGPIDPASNVGPLAPTSSTYGPPAGFGIYGSSGMPMPEGSSGPSPAARGGRSGGGPGSGPGGPGGPMHPY